MTERTYSITEEELLPLSALQHYIFCRRQCALIHVEQVWSENLFTAEGRLMHDHVDTAGDISRGDVRIEYGVPLRSFRLGLIGKADVVEFHRCGDELIPFPVEYKRGKPKGDMSDRVQLCAQAICLEEMMNVAIPGGALFYGRTRRRQEVVFDETLRLETEETARHVHDLIQKRETPPPELSKKCKSCSLVQACMPDTCARRKKASRYLLNAVSET